MSITYQVETFDQVVEDIKPMIQHHYEEIATDKHVKPLDPDWGKYQAMEEAGVLRIFTARDHVEPVLEVPEVPPVLVGYFISVVSPGLHYQQTMMALNDIMYVAPGYRGSTVGYRLIKHAAEDLKNLGVHILTIHMKTDYPFRNLLIRLGFHLTEENWERVL
jgi:GNAT superfamily N-acetyltransferase